MIFKVIDISMKTIYQKNENRLSANFVPIRPVIEKLMPISKITMYGKGNMISNMISNNS